MRAMSVAIIGTGKIGGNLAKRFTQHGVKVTLAASKLENAQKVADELGELATAVTADDAIANNEILIFAVPFAKMQEIVAEKKEQLKGKIFVDPSNNIGWTEDRQVLNLNEDGTSAAHKISTALDSETKYVKAFGTMAAFELPEEVATSGSGKVVSFYATNDEAAGKQVAELAEAAGWDAVKVGGVEAAGRIEVFGDLHPFGGLKNQLLNKEEALKLV